MSDITGIIPSKQKLSGYVGTDDQQLTGFIVPRGNKGISPVVTVEQIEGGHTVTFEDIYGKQSFDVMDGAVGPKGEQGIRGEQGEKGDTVVGPQGAPGADGYTPVKGEDYFTPKELEETAAQAAGMITLESIGAAPAMHGHSEYSPTTHSHSEYAPTTHSHTEYAPSGYGLGEMLATKTSITDAHGISKTGWYFASGSTANVPAGGIIRAEVYAWALIKLTLYTNAIYSDGSIAILHKELTGNGWSEWEYESPKMVLGVEYRTTERYNGNPVYAKLIDFGNLPATSTKKISTGITGGKMLVQCTATLHNGILLPYLDTGASYDTYQMYVRNANTAEVTIKTTGDYSAFTAQVLLKYTKN